MSDLRARLVSAENCIKELEAENERLRELLRDHGADPDGGQALGGTAG